MSAPDRGPGQAGRKTATETATETGAGMEAGAVRRRQLLLFSVIAATALIAVALWMGSGGGKAPPPAGGIEAGIVAPDMAETVWTRRSEARLGGIERRLNEMEREAKELQGENLQLRARLEENADNARVVIDRQAAAIDDLERRLQGGAPQAGAATVPAPGGGSASDPYFRVPSLTPSSGNNGQAQPAAPAPMIETFELKDGPQSSLTGSPTGPELVADSVAKPVGVWLPAGSHAQAVVLAGVDAAAGVSSQGDPRPVLLRITGPAWTAAEDGTAMQVDIDGCTVTGAAHGDLSSEKVYARLQTMTCAGPKPGTVVETPVAGFVAGSGKTGVRGPVVSREGALVEKAFLAGMISGAGQGVAQAFQPQAVATGGGGAAVANTALADIGRAGLGAGASSAGQKVADYMIRRAEQYQPVIQLQAGTKVTLVFLEGARIDGRAPQPQTAQGGK
ncbi:MAG: hypothetical protein OXH59_19235 [Rhodospirillaceae bacterium]|nr:hypothetical protein [Rhodospirillaceae bacterium]